jgi:hypothetical protein
MADNPYQPPLVKPWRPPEAPRRGISILAVVLGVLTDIGSTVIVGIVIGVVVAIVLLSQGVPPDRLAEYLEGPVYRLASLVPGLGCTVLGGFVAGRVAKRSELLHGAIVGSIVVLLGAPFWPSLPIGYSILSYLALSRLRCWEAGCRWLDAGNRRRLAKRLEVCEG